MIPAYRRFESTGSDEKVKGAVIGIDLGKPPCNSFSGWTETNVIN